MTAGSRRCAGFSLVEMLAALVVLGLVVGGLSQGMRFGVQAWGRAATLTANGNTLDAVDRTLRRMVAQMHPGTTSRPAVIAAGPGSLGFVSLLPGSPPRRVEAMLLVDSQRRLVLRWRPYADASASLTETELLPDVTAFALAYWQPAAGWSPRWDGPGLPSLIRIRLGVAAGGGRPWPDIIVAPGLDPS